MNSLTRRLLLALPIPFFTPGPAKAQASPGVRPRRPDVWNRTELYFGTGKPDGSAVSDTQFAVFVDEQVTPRFPDGLTLLSGYGQFNNSAGVLKKEKSFVLILFYPPQMTDAGKRIEEIRETFKTMFQQESVLRADGSTFLSF